MRSTRKNFMERIENGSADDTKAAYAAYCSSLDKAVKRNIIAKNNAIRNKSRAAARMRKATAK